jgi:dUTP pyrophosphatase
VVKAKQTLMVGTGWKFGLPNPWALVVLPRSGMGAKQGVVLGNLCLWNRGSVDRIITRGDAVCQAVAMPIEQATFRVVDKFKTTTARGAGGYGSTDKGKA